MSKGVRDPLLLVSSRTSGTSMGAGGSRSAPATVGTNVEGLLGLFAHSGCITFATAPCTGVFVGPSDASRVLSSSLFPESFVCTLRTPAGCVKTEAVFPRSNGRGCVIGGGSSYRYCLPRGRGGSFVPDARLPLSLERTLTSFFVTGTIHSLENRRGGRHSVLVGVDEFVSIRGEVYGRISDCIQRLRHRMGGCCQLNATTLRRRKVTFVGRMFSARFTSLDSRVLSKRPHFA